ncbi:MAG: CTP synthase [Candidatus Lokiarchaeota archaeon]|nr:CTP synthase [Candidatus Lokiarchaeota archaeon]MBD3339041.1 CTP synthase [Candidatus Lokiarchaeota archaeon]
MGCKFVFTTGGVMSGIGKGVVTASMGKILQFRGFKVSVVKIDPYLNVDPGTLNPIEHGECFITEEVWDFKPVPGSDERIYRISEIDQDFGTYERFLGIDIHPAHNITSGQIYLATILRERKGKFLGRTVQIIPHCTNMIKDRLIEIANTEDLDILLIECGGTVGDLESDIFLESFRQLKLELPKNYTAFVHVTLVPYSRAVGQQKSKPTQHSVKMLQSAGLQPDIIICRSEQPLAEDIRKKISLFSNVPVEAVVSNPDLETVYELPLLFENQHLGDLLCNILDLKAKLVSFNEVTNYSEWVKMVDLYKNSLEPIKIGMPGKYFNISDSYISINDAVEHAAAHLGYKAELKMINITNSTEIEEELSDCSGILLTPGFGKRAIEGMITSAEYAMEHRIPFLGICLGAQLFYVAFCRKYLGLKGANSTEIDPETSYPVVDLLESQKVVNEMGGTMRLGGIEIKVEEGTRLYDAYKKKEIVERFRHRYHLQERFITDEARNNGLIVSSYDKTRKIINSIELDRDDHFAVGTQFHPEFKSRPFAPSPIYLEYVKACIAYKEKKKL